MSSTVTPNALFVYGTLKRGESNHARVRRARRVMPARTRGLLIGLPFGPYPAMVEGDGVVSGELCVFEDLAPLLPEIDAYEDFDPRDPDGSLYRRIVVDVSAGGEVVRAWTYVMAKGPQGSWVIPSGVWTGR